MTPREDCPKHFTYHGSQFHLSYRSTTYALERASGQISHKGIKRLTRSSNWCTIFGSKSNPKNTCREERDLKPDEKGQMFMSHVAHCDVARAKLEKNRGCRGCQAMKGTAWRGPVQRHVVQQVDNDRVRPER